LIHALERLDENGMLRQLNKKIYIGQGFKGEELSGIGVGICTRGCETNIAGCPPKAKEILKHIEELI
jgi:hypothetical protein